MLCYHDDCLENEKHDDDRAGPKMTSKWGMTTLLTYQLHKGSFTMVKRADFEGEMRANLSLGAARSHFICSY